MHYDSEGVETYNCSLWHCYKGRNGMGAKGYRKGGV